MQTQARSILCSTTACAMPRPGAPTRGTARARRHPAPCLRERPCEQVDDDARCRHWHRCRRNADEVLAVCPPIYTGERVASTKQYRAAMQRTALKKQRTALLSQVVAATGSPLPVPLGAFPGGVNVGNAADVGAAIAAGAPRS
eukprot:5308638-Prymnesium_polylepis.1